MLGQRVLPSSGAALAAIQTQLHNETLCCWPCDARGRANFTARKSLNIDDEEN